MEADGKHDALSNKEVAEKMNEAGFASQVKKHACKDVSRHEHASCTHIVDMRARAHTHTCSHSLPRTTHTHVLNIYSGSF